MRKFAFLAAVAAALAFMAPSPAQAQIILGTGSSYYGGYSSGYSPYGYSGMGLYGNNFGLMQSGYGIGNYGGYYPSYSSGYGNGYGYRGYNSSFYRGNGYYNRGYSRGVFGGRRR
jgi:hypothetical protein